VSTGDREDVRRAREELMSIEERRLGLSERVMRGEPEALKEDRRLEARLRELAHWLMRVEREEDERHTETERRGEQLREAWRQRHPEEEDGERR